MLGMSSDASCVMPHDLPPEIGFYVIPQTRATSCPSSSLFSAHRVTFISGVDMSVNMPHLCDLLSTALDPTRLTAAALVSTTGAIVVSASKSTKSKDRTAIIMASLATAMWEDAAMPGEKEDEVRASPT